MSDDICNESFNVTAVQVTAHEGAGIRHQCMVCRRGQSCNTTTTESTLADQVRAWDTSGIGFSIEPRQISSGDIEFDFGHWLLVAGAGYATRTT
jgi:hypothetical protein